MPEAPFYGVEEYSSASTNRRRCVESLPRTWGSLSFLRRTASARRTGTGKKMIACCHLLMAGVIEAYRPSHDRTAWSPFLSIFAGCAGSRPSNGEMEWGGWFLFSELTWTSIAARADLSSTTREGGTTTTGLKGKKRREKRGRRV